MTPVTHSIASDYNKMTKSFMWQNTCLLHKDCSPYPILFLLGMHPRPTLCPSFLGHSRLIQQYATKSAWVVGGLVVLRVNQQGHGVPAHRKPLLLSSPWWGSRGDFRHVRSTSSPLCLRSCCYASFSGTWVSSFQLDCQAERSSW